MTESERQTTIEPAPPTASSDPARRALLRAGIGIGTLGALFGGLGAQSVLAAPDDDGDDPADDGEFGPDAIDGQSSTLETLGDLDPAAQRDLMSAMLAAELATRDLYQSALDAGADPAVSGGMERQHRAYADAISGAIGESASTPSESLLAEWQSRFETSDTAAMAAAATGLESALVATYEGLIGLVDDGNWVRVMSAIAMAEARHSVVLATIAGQADDLTTLFDPAASPLNVEELS